MKKGKTEKKKGREKEKKNGEALYLFSYYCKKHCIVYIYNKMSSFSISFWGALYILKSHHCLPFYFEEHCIFFKSRQCLPIYFGEHCICMRSLHFPFYNV